MAKKTPRQIKLGTYALGCMRFTVYANLQNGACFSVAGDGPGTMHIGVRGPWADAIAHILHEATEAVAMELHLRYDAWPEFAHDSAGCLFVMNHEMFAEAVARVGEFLVPVLPELAKAHKALNRRQRRSG